MMMEIRSGQILRVAFIQKHMNAVVTNDNERDDYLDS
jgi:hypothetical protein